MISRRTLDRRFPEVCYGLPSGYGQGWSGERVSQTVTADRNESAFDSFP